MSDIKGSGASGPSPKGRDPRSKEAKKPGLKKRGRPVDEKKRAKRSQASPPVVVCSNSSHPACEPGTFDAATLLASVLAVVEPRLQEGLQALERSLPTAQREAGDQTASVSDVRAVGRQITEALRAGVVEGMRTRERHLAQLVVIDRAAAQSQVLLRLQQRIGAEIEKAGLRRVVDLENLALFNLADGTTESADNASTPAFELVTPAYVDSDSGRVIERGWVRRAPSDGASLPQGKTHGRVSRQHKGKTAESGSQPSQHESGAAGFPQRADGEAVPEKDPAVTESLAQTADLSSTEVAPSTTPAGKGDRSDFGKNHESAGAGRRPEGENGTATDPGGDGTTEGGNGTPYAGPVERSAPLIPASFFIRRLLGHTAEEEQSRWRSS
ncbi:hypothetical protein OG713_08435 [Streptomyces sp. NBC_00723]|uniref:hypothetical protein n=1 Tax=Streptomyces sp. NBC_00723 TaxID=2903673 RepID=UPI00386616DD